MSTIVKSRRGQKRARPDFEETTTSAPESAKKQKLDSTKDEQEEYHITPTSSTLLPHCSGEVIGSIAQCLSMVEVINLVQCGCRLLTAKLKQSPQFDTARLYTDNRPTPSFWDTTLTSFPYLRHLDVSGFGLHNRDVRSAWLSPTLISLKVPMSRYVIDVQSPQLQLLHAKSLMSNGLEGVNLCDSLRELRLDELFTSQIARLPPDLTSLHCELVTRNGSHLCCLLPLFPKCISKLSIRCGSYGNNVSLLCSPCLNKSDTAHPALEELCCDGASNAFIGTPVVARVFPRLHTLELLTLGHTGHDFSSYPCLTNLSVDNVHPFAYFNVEQPMFPCSIRHLVHNGLGYKEMDEMVKAGMLPNAVHISVASHTVNFDEYMKFDDASKLKSLRQVIADGDLDAMKRFSLVKRLSTSVFEPFNASYMINLGMEHKKKDVVLWLLKTIFNGDSFGHPHRADLWTLARYVCNDALLLFFHSNFWNNDRFCIWWAALRCICRSKPRLLVQAFKSHLLASPQMTNLALTGLYLYCIGETGITEEDVAKQQTLNWNHAETKADARWHVIYCLRKFRFDEKKQVLSQSSASLRKALRKLLDLYQFPSSIVRSALAFSMTTAQITAVTRRTL